MYKVLSVDAHQGVHAMCVWGQQIGEEIYFQDLGQVLELINKKRG